MFLELFKTFLRRPNFLFIRKFLKDLKKYQKNVLTRLRQNAVITMYKHLNRFL